MLSVKVRLSVLALVSGLVALAGCGGGGGEAPAAPAAPTGSITVSPTSITVGSSATLNWSMSNAATCTASGAWSGAQATSGTQTLSPGAAATYTYTLACQNAA